MQRLKLISPFRHTKSDHISDGQSTLKPTSHDGTPRLGHSDAGLVILRQIQEYQLFDAEFYLGANKDVARAGIDPLEHFCSHGHIEGRWPNRNFDPIFYRDHHLAGDKSINPLFHYVQEGMAQNLACIPIDHRDLFDEAYYLRRYPDVGRAGVDPFLHFNRHGHLEGRWPNQYFDPHFYRRRHLEGDHKINPLAHYFFEGQAQGLPRSELDVMVERTASSANAPLSEFRHPAVSPIRNDFKEFCIISGIFDEVYYKSAPPELNLSEDEAFNHYITVGWLTGRDPSRIFSTNWYVANHLCGRDDINPLLHFYQSGLYQGHSISPALSKGYSISASRILSNTAGFIYADVPDISIIIINYNGAHHFPDLIESLENLNYENYEIIVVDNGSTDGSVEWLAEHAPSVRTIELTENIGFADAVNLGFDAANTQLVAMLNNDVVVDPDWLTSLVDALRSTPQRAAVTSKMLFWKPFFQLTLRSTQAFTVNIADMLNGFEYKKYFIDTGSERKGTLLSEENVISVKLPFEPNATLSFTPMHDPDAEAAAPFNIFVNDVCVDEDDERVTLNLNDWRFRNVGRMVVNNAGSFERSPDVVADRGFGQFDVGQYDFAQDVDYLCGGAFILNRSALNGNPVFIGDLFAYYEDTELSVRLRQNGYTIGYDPNSVIYHKHASTSNEKSAFFHRMVERNYTAYFARKRGLPRAASQVHDKKMTLNHLSNYFKNQPEPTAIEAELSTVYPAVCDELDNIYNSFFNSTEFRGSHRPLRIGVYNLFWSTSGGGEFHALKIAAYLARYGVVDLICESDFDLDALLSRFGFPKRLFRKVLLRSFSEVDTAHYDVFINSTYGSNLNSLAKHSYYIVSFPHRFLAPEMAKAYTFLANSEFTRHWCREFWGDDIRIRILYPCVDLKTPRDGFLPKEKMILNVGRFFRQGHCKMQHEMVETFRQLLSEDERFSDWSLVLVGGVNYDHKGSVDYFNEVKELAQGLPVELVPNARGDVVAEYYSRSALYWHATGFGLNVSTDPFNFEHFGIATVEAMSAGSIPIVIDAAGPVEVVNNSAFGSRFKDREEWIAESLKWMQTFEDNAEAFGDASVRASHAFTRYNIDAFARRCATIFADVELADATIEKTRGSSDFSVSAYWRYPNIAEAG